MVLRAKITFLVGCYVTNYEGLSGHLACFLSPELPGRRGNFQFVSTTPLEKTSRKSQPALSSLKMEVYSVCVCHSIVLHHIFPWCCNCAYSSVFTVLFHCSSFLSLIELNECAFSRRLVFLLFIVLPFYVACKAV